MSAVSQDPHLEALDDALGARAPACIAHAWQATIQHADSPGERFSARYAFLETALRYLVATLAAEHTARALPPASGWTALRAALRDKLSLGHWADAARDLARVVLASEAPILGRLAGVLAERPARGKVRLAPAWGAVNELVTLRNEQSHPECRLTAESFLARSESPFHTFLTAFRVVAELPVRVVTEVHAEGAGLTLDLLELTGTGRPRRHRVPVTRALPRGRPFVLAADGRVLELAPMLVWDTFPTGAAGARPTELRLFLKWHDAPRYADPRGIERAVAPANASAVADPEAWLRDGPRIVADVFAGQPASLRAPAGSSASAAGGADPDGLRGAGGSAAARSQGATGMPAGSAGATSAGAGSPGAKPRTPGRPPSAAQAPPDSEPHLRAAGPASPPPAADPRPGADTPPSGTTWTPPPPDTDEEAAPSLLPGGILGLVSVLFLPAWPVLIVRALLVLARLAPPRPPAEAEPAYLPRARRFRKVADPAEVARALDDLAFVVLAQRAVRGVEVASDAELAQIRAHPLALTWATLALSPATHLPEHRGALGGPGNRAIARRAVRHVHGALARGALSIPPGCAGQVNRALALLRTLAHAGARGAPAERVEAWLARGAPPTA